jgi:hypothetical protein
MLLPGGPVPIRFPVTHTFPILTQPDRPSGEDAAADKAGPPPPLDQAGGGAPHARPSEECHANGEKLAAEAEAGDGHQEDGDALDGPAKKRGRMQDGLAAALSEEKVASTATAADDESAEVAAPVPVVGGAGVLAAEKEEVLASEPQAVKEEEPETPAL